MSIGISELFSGLQFAEKVALYVNKFLKRPEPDSPASRFLALFNAHGVKPSQIPEFFGYGLSIADCHCADSLTKVLTTGQLEQAAKLFGVNKDWLYCASEQVYEPHNFYKNPQGFEEYFKGLNIDRTTPVRATLYMPARNKWLKCFYPEHSGLLVIYVPMGEINQRTIYRVELVSYECAFYWHTRGYLAANLAHMLRKYAVVYGTFVSPKLLEPVAQGQRIPVYEYESHHPFSLKAAGRFSIEELISCPDKYLHGVDPEQDSYGHRAALDLWLSMADRMRIWNKEQHSSNVANFEDALRRVISL
ncbi:hypothetical protein [Shewanella salipaludis]|uniref:Uncharacterized protein n=1 Tax=Shewanella salipaludis TaxID=2723052 RepID=A0A972JLH9_9GAMM|nr:hypothetical protein [Shewanella salipaludis]NMH65467.1 hypothetical protein [Shewanella salipaludis]